jgi:hypothetical protein
MSWSDAGSVGSIMGDLRRGLEFLRNANGFSTLPVKSSRP